MSTSVVPLDSLSPGGDINRYIHTVNSLPILSAEKERELASRFYEGEDLDAARELVLSHLRFVVHLARSYSGYGLPQADLIQEGNVGLMKAVKRFNPNVGVRLVTFAVHWIKAEIHEYIIRNWRIVKIATTKAQRKLFFNLRNRTKSLSWLTKDETKAIAADLGVKPKEVTLMEGRMSGQDVSFDTPLQEKDDDDSYDWSPAATLADDRPGAEQQLIDEDYAAHMQDRLRKALDELDERSRAILQNRWLNNERSTLTELSKKFKISPERVRQLESKALKKLRTWIEADGTA